MTLAQAIGHALAEARHARRWTQAEVAERVGISVEFYGRVERGHALPGVSTLACLAATLDISIEAAIRQSQIGGDGLYSTAIGTPADEPPALRRLKRRLRRASSATLRLVHGLLDELCVPAEDEEDEEEESETTEVGNRPRRRRA